MVSGPAAAFTVRPAREPDLPSMISCLSSAFEPFRELYTPEAYLHTTLNEELGRERLASMHVLVAVDSNQRVIGTLTWHLKGEGWGHLRGMAVLPESQGTGVAQALLDQALAALRDEGCHRVTLRTTRPLARAVHFYEKNGFRDSGVVADFHGMPVIERIREI